MAETNTNALRELDLEIKNAADAINAGGLVLFPTESFYGLAVLPTNQAAVDRLIELKGRASDKPIPLLAGSVEAADAVAEIPAALRPLIDEFWPGPLTIAAEPRILLPDAVVGLQRRVGVRVSGESLARKLADAAGGVVTATSANLAGGKPATTVCDLDPKIVSVADAIIHADCGPNLLPSTVVGFSQGEVVLLREGAITVKQIEELLGVVVRCR